MRAFVVHLGTWFLKLCNDLKREPEIGVLIIQYGGIHPYPVPTKCALNTSWDLKLEKAFDSPCVLFA